jgi:DNA-binding transcriptional MerR regulator
VEGYPVGEVAALSGVTVRTLHHYDEIGLLVPGHRSPSGYRLYTPDDLERLQRILGYRALGLPLEQIGRVLAAPAADQLAHLRGLHEALSGQVDRLRRQLAAIEKTLEAHQMGIRLTPQEMFEVFGEEDPTQHAAEAEERWGDTEAYRESQRRTSRYTKADWLRVKAEGEAVEARLRAVMTQGLPATSEEAMDAAEAHRLHIDGSFYPCSHAMHRGLADMYLADPRFTAHYDDQAPGLAQYVHDAIHANADRAAS